MPCQLGIFYKTRSLSTFKQVIRFGSKCLKLGCLTVDHDYAEDIIFHFFVYLSITIKLEPNRYIGQPILT